LRFTACAPSASGAAEGLFRNSTVTVIQQRIADKCLNKSGRTVEDVSPMQITCAAQFYYGMQNVAALLAVGGDSNQRVWVKVRYSILQIGPDVRVVTNTRLQNRSPIGSDVTQSYNDNRLQNTIHASLVSMGAE
jgi:hypothetical protein